MSKNASFLDTLLLKMNDLHDTETCELIAYEGAKPFRFASHRWVTGYAGQTRQCMNCNKVVRLDTSFSCYWTLAGERAGAMSREEVARHAYEAGRRTATELKQEPLVNRFTK